MELDPELELELEAELAVRCVACMRALVCVAFEFVDAELPVFELLFVFELSCVELLAATGASPTFETVALIVWLGSDEDVMVAFSPVEIGRAHV